MNSIEIRVAPIKTGVSAQLTLVDNDMPICWIWHDICGYWKADLSTFGDGFMESHHLRAIADKLDELNAPYEAHLKEYFENQPHWEGSSEIKLDF